MRVAFYGRVSTPRRYENRRSARPGRLYVLRGRVRCGLCGRRMEGSHQRGSNWYRCQYARRRSGSAADVAGHPRVLGIKEDVVLEALRELMAVRLFGPDRLQLLGEELAASASGQPQSHRVRSRAAASRAAEDRGKPSPTSSAAGGA